MTLHVETIEFGFQGERVVKNYNQLRHVKAMLMELPEEDLQETPANFRLQDFFRPDSVFIYTTDGHIIYGYIMIETPKTRSAYVVRKWSNGNKESEDMLSASAWATLRAHQVGGRPKKVKLTRRHTKKRR